MIETGGSNVLKFRVCIWIVFLISDSGTSEFDRAPTVSIYF